MTHRRLLSLLVLLGLLLAGCQPTEPEEGDQVEAPSSEAENPIYLAIIWHQHQPVYYRDPQSGLYSRPWVRVHATKDYVDMAAMLEQYPEIHATFNLTPSLIRQIDDFEAGAKDLYWAYAEIPADELSEEQKQFILDRFFDTNREIIGRFPRYQELLNLRDNSSDPLAAYGDQDFRDLQVLFNLAWVDPDWLAQEPLAALVEKGEGFAEADKEVLFAEHRRLIAEVIPIHRRLQEAGQIEVTMTPFAHPILPLLVTTQLAREALPELELPSQTFIYGQDAVAQVELGVRYYEDHFGQPPSGMWPAEGSVAQEIVSMVSQNGIQWMASDEGVLANSLGFDSFERDTTETVLETETLYRPYYVQGTRGDPVAILFRDVVISDKVGFTYSGMDGSAAAADFVDRILSIRERLLNAGAEGPHLVTVLLDGENAWEYYENDGKEFLNGLYQRLSEEALIKTVTPSEFLALAPEQSAIEDLWAGSWINHDFSTWIGEEEENRAWDLLAETRDFLQEFISGARQDDVSAEQLDEALLQMYIAEGSDWFWWYGSDQNSGNDESFDEQYRNTLKSVYDALGESPPIVLDVPIIPQSPTIADVPASGLISPLVDGGLDAEEWASGATYLAMEDATQSTAFFEQLSYGFDAQNLYLGIQRNPQSELPIEGGRLQVYLSVPGGRHANSFSTGGSLLGFPGELHAEITFANSGQVANATLYEAAADGAWDALTELEEAVADGNGIELAIALELLGSADIGDQITLRAIFQQATEEGGQGISTDVDQIPAGGPALVAVPDLGTTTVLVDIQDPESDDYGPGAYTYPQDAVFNAGNFDVTRFQVGEDEDNIVFRFNLRGPVDNAWDSPNGLSLQTLDIYIDQDQDGVGGVALLPGRNLALAAPHSWDYAIHIEGWFSGIYVPTDTGVEQVASASEFQILADPGQRKVTIRVPKTLLGDNPEDWAYAALVLSQEGFPSAGVMRVRDVQEVAEQWRVGGAPAGASNHTRALDIVWAEASVQESWLSTFEPVSGAQSELTAEDFATIEMFGLDLP